MSILIIILMSLYLTQKRKEPIERFIPFSVMVIMTIIFVLSMVNLLSFIVPITIIAIVIMVAMVIVNRKTLDITLIFTPAATAWMLTGVVVTVLFYNHVNVYGDDINYYAIFPKCVYYLEKLPDMTNCLYQRWSDYSPIRGLYFYWVMKCNGSFSEASMYITNIWLIYTLMLSLWSGITWKTSKVRILFNFIIILLLPFLITSGFATALTIDIIVGSVFAYALYSVVDNDNKDTFYYLRCAITLAVLGLMKTSAILPAVLILIMFLILEFLQNNKKFIISRKVLIVVAFTVVPYYTWNIWCRLNGMTDYLQTNLKNNILSDTIKMPIRKAIKHYIKAVFLEPINGNEIGLTIFISFILLFVVVLVLIKIRKCNVTDIMTVIMLIVGFGLFSIGLIVMKVSAFESNEVSEYGRYWGQFSTCIVWYIIYRINDFDVKKWQMIII